MYVSHGYRVDGVLLAFKLEVQVFQICKTFLGILKGICAQYARIARIAHAEPRIAYSAPSPAASAPVPLQYPNQPYQSGYPQPVYSQPISYQPNYN